jgi:hypothetical protein
VYFGKVVMSPKNGAHHCAEIPRKKCLRCIVLLKSFNVQGYDHRIGSKGSYITVEKIDAS